MQSARSEAHAFECSVDLRTSCDVYLPRYSAGVVRVTRLEVTSYCIDLEDASPVRDEE